MEGRTPYWDLKREAVFKILDEFPDSSTRQISRIIYEKHPAFFKDAEACRSYVRSYRGQRGNVNRAKFQIKKYYKPIQKV